MPLLRMRSASFRLGSWSVAPVTLDVEPGELAARTFASAREAAVVALMAAGIVKASSGCVLIGDFDPRVQSVHCKRIAGFVPHEPVGLEERDFAAYVAYRAALWNVEARLAFERASALRTALGDMHEAFALPFIGALLAGPELIVLDRPMPAYAERILRVAGGKAVLSTHTNVAAARAFRRRDALRATPA
ncbi:MAG: hypothetical protein JO190_09700 [Candidatus Eremiobacteraeota bacterium]|nr:hypothetical protein [Candidatus Eremiobacteraeota bacterium]MBV8498984.1 hypothetical protein [Candidatus Eremiobacteraeota bacterium]